MSSVGLPDDGGGTARLVDAAWLREHLGDEDLRVVDSRWTPTGGARAGYLAGHIPGAVFVDVDADLAAPPSPIVGRHPLPEPEAFAAAMSRAGIGDTTLVVTYDDTGGSTAARLWWMLTALGHPCAMLDGGLAAWDTPLQTGDVHVPPASFTPAPWPTDQIVDADGVTDALSAGGVLLDARAPARFRGEMEPIDPVAGHVPGATNAPFDANLGPDGLLRTPTDLRAYFESLGVVEGGDVMASCGSGVTACHDIFAVERAGLGRPKLYVGSWSGWCSDPARPIATDAPHD